MHFKIKVSIYLDKEAKEKPAIPRSNTFPSWPCLSPVPSPSTHLPAAISRCRASGFKSSSRGKQKPQVQRASLAGGPHREGWEEERDLPQRSVSSKTSSSKGFQTWFLSGLPGQIKRYEVPTGRDVFLLLRCQVCKGDPGFWAQAGFQEQGRPSRCPSDSFHPYHQGSRISPTNKAVCDSEHFLGVKALSAFYKSAPGTERDQLNAWNKKSS